MIFAFDNFVNGVPYPNLAQWQAQPGTRAWRQFADRSPYSEPVHFLEYLKQENVAFEAVNVNSAPNTAIYPISVSFFDFTVKWFDLMPKITLNRIKNKDLKVWFLYSEGDNPFLIKKHLISQCEQSGVEWNQIHFTSANTAAEQIDNFSYFADDEMLYRLRNRSPGLPYHEQPRTKKFTALSRTHKWWRATTMARIWHKNLHTQGYFSYNNQLDVGEVETDNPIEIDRFYLRNTVYDFVDSCPFSADEQDSDWHNLYHHTVDKHHTNSYLNLILETHLDADQSGGTFLTEKTFKPIKHSQLFLIVGPPGSVAQLRKMGYKTFDTWIDHGYDSIKNNTQRWDAVMREFERLCASNLHRIYIDCCASIKHNQRLFLSDKSQRLNTLLQKVQHEQS